jgi:hypothetical protein
MPPQKYSYFAATRPRILRAKTNIKKFNLAMARRRHPTRRI